MKSSVIVTGALVVLRNVVIPDGLLFMGISIRPPPPPAPCCCGMDAPVADCIMWRWTYEGGATSGGIPTPGKFEWQSGNAYISTNRSGRERERGDQDRHVPSPDRLRIFLLPLVLPPFPCSCRRCFLLISDSRQRVSSKGTVATKSIEIRIR